jgi:RNA polymerase sigma-70 factor (ECF subfamily)
MVKGLRSGRESAYEQLFKDYYKPLTVFANGYVEDLESGKEIVQDLFVHLYEKRKTLVITSSIKSYLYQSVRNRCLNHIKHRQMQRIHHDRMKPAKDFSDDLEERIRENELEHLVFKVVDKLPPQCKKIFTMSRVSGLNNGEIAEQLNISKRTVETQISNALKILREKLKY